MRERSESAKSYHNAVSGRRSESLATSARTLAGYPFAARAHAGVSASGKSGSPPGASYTSRLIRSLRAVASRMQPIDTLVIARWVIPIEAAAQVIEAHAVAIHHGGILALLPSQEAERIAGTSPDP